MRVIIACALVAGAILAALGLAQTQNLFAPPGLRGTAPVAAAPPPPPAAPGPTVTTVNDDEPPAPAAPITIAAATAAPAAAAAPVSAPAPAAPAPAAAAPTPSPAPAPTPAAAKECPGNPDALGISRTVEIDTTGGPGFGFEHFKTHDFLKPGEVVLTFDDGPWLNHTPMVLAALAHHCLKATFFPIGKHATYYPEILKQVAEAGHTIGSHTWGHVDLSKKSVEDAKTEIELGLSAVHMAVGGPTAPFFRFPALKHPPELVTYLGERNIAIFSTDIDSFDFRLHKPEQVIRSVMEKLKKRGKGIVLMHDFQRATAEALPELLDQLKANGYKIVHMRAKAPVQTLPNYDEMLLKEQKLPTVSSRPTSDIVHTINE